jgi:hypothetical protein
LDSFIIYRTFYRFINIYAQFTPQRGMPVSLSKPVLDTLPGRMLAAPGGGGRLSFAAAMTPYFHSSSGLTSPNGVLGGKVRAEGASASENRLDRQLAIDKLAGLA